MGFFDFLKKTGTVQAGKTTWKGDAKDRPVEMNDNPANDISPDDNTPTDMDNSSDNNSSDDK
jgi:hypothetical protein